MLDDNRIVSFPLSYCNIFTQCPSDHCLFIKGSSSHFLALLIYIDDVLITGPCEQDIQNAKQFLNQAFTIKDLGIAK